MDVTSDLTATLRAQANHPPIVFSGAFLAKNSATARSIGYEGETSPTLNAGTPPSTVCVYDNHGQDSRITKLDDETNSVVAQYGTGGNNTPLVIHSYGIQGNIINRTVNTGGNGSGVADEESGTLTVADRHAVSYSLSKNSFMTREEEEEVGTLVATDYKDPPVTVQVPKYIVRRIAPIECERLQGFPDNWTDIGEWIDSKGRKRKTTDSARYKALGNSIALPYWKVLARKIAAQYDRDITMGSLFDGIGGFPLVFTHCGAECRWVSEIDDFPIAVTKYHWEHGDFK